MIINQIASGGGSSVTPTVYLVTMDAGASLGGKTTVTTASGDTFELTTTPQQVVFVGEQDITIKQNGTSNYHEVTSGCIQSIGSGGTSEDAKFHIGGSSTTGSYTYIYDP